MNVKDRPEIFFVTGIRYEPRFSSVICIDHLQNDS